MATVSKTNHPFKAQFRQSISGVGVGTFTQALAVVPAGQALVISQFNSGTNCIINFIDSSGNIWDINLAASSEKSYPNNLVLGPGTYTLNVTLAGAYSWTAVGYYVTINT